MDLMKSRFFAIFALPLRLGEMARPALTKLRQGIPVSVGFGTIAVERVVDGLVTSLCVAWALFAIPMMLASLALISGETLKVVANRLAGRQRDLPKKVFRMIDIDETGSLSKSA